MEERSAAMAGRISMLRAMPDSTHPADIDLTTAPKRASRGVIAAGVLTGIVFLSLLAYGQRETLLRGETDFTAFYIGGKLAGTGLLYDRDANYNVMREIHPEVIPALIYIRPPFQAILFRPLTWLPYRAAFFAFVLLSLCAAIWYIVRFLPDFPELPLFAALCLPLLAALMNGQDTVLLLALTGAAILAARGGHDFKAGVLLSLCAVKAHLFLLVPLVLLRARRWKVVSGGLAGGAILLVMSFQAGGWDWPRRYLSALASPVFEPHSHRMLNLRGCALALGGQPWSVPLEIVLLLAVLALFAAIVRSRRDFELNLGAALVTGLLIGRHTALMDYVLLLAAMPLLLKGSRSATLRLALTLAITPPLHLLALIWQPGNVLVVAVLLGALAALAWDVGRETAGDVKRQVAAVPCARLPLP